MYVDDLLAAETGRWSPCHRPTIGDTTSGMSLCKESSVLCLQEVQRIQVITQIPTPRQKDSSQNFLELQVIVGFGYPGFQSWPAPYT